MNKKQVYLTKASEETKKLAFNFSKRLKPGDFLAFYGNLGSGKTTFIQGLAEGLGINARIISPTFIIIRTYKINNQKSIIKNQDQRPKAFYHIDLYRTESKNDLLELGIDEIIEDKNNIIAVEWAEKMKDMLPDKRIELHFKYVDENTREISIKYI